MHLRGEIYSTGFDANRNRGFELGGFGSVMSPNEETPLFFTNIKNIPCLYFGRLLVYSSFYPGMKQGIVSYKTFP